ncbi:Site-specific recombinase, DNA invertase Pin [Frankia canadensis]|uniref:Site-specific recombinase, DNA invertase Pin n=1 Tax=Frankia canadensis TaxID=1836972 RepID=A0A2I2KL06_9ACTN|nr:Site-specific recombinase, DNA invertase Pin [Frankia canadensis]SOU53633.1 Site-specific recombinase, DNA invertase Pin [Frankia canadensis]
MVANVRISDDREGREAGVTRQAEDCLSLINRHEDWELIAPVFVDNDLSATKESVVRPGFEEIMSMVMGGLVDVVVSWTANRFFRSRKDRIRVIELFRETNTRLIAVNGPSYDFTTADGRMMADLIGAIDTAEVERIAERTTRAAKQRAENGEDHGGHRSFGWNPENRNELMPEHAKMLNDAADKVLAGKSVNSIAVELSRISGREWNIVTLGRLLKNPAIAGLRVYQGKIIGPAKWPAIISVEKWEQVCAKLNDASRRTTTGNQVKRLLPGFLFCSSCGHRMVSAASAKMYNCPPRSQRRFGWKSCDMKASIRQSAIDEAIIDLIPQRLEQLHLTAPSSVDPSGIETELAGLEKRAESISDDYAAGKMKIGEANMLLAGINRRAESLRADLDATRRRTVAIPLDAATMWDSGDLTARRSILTLLIDGIIVQALPDMGKADPHQVRVVWRDLSQKNH